MSVEITFGQCNLAGETVQMSGLGEHVDRTARVRMLDANVPSAAKRIRMRVHDRFHKRPLQERVAFLRSMGLDE